MRTCSCLALTCFNHPQMFLVLVSTSKWEKNPKTKGFLSYVTLISTIVWYPKHYCAEEYQPSSKPSEAAMPLKKPTYYKNSIDLKL